MTQKIFKIFKKTFENYVKMVAYIPKMCYNKNVKRRYKLFINIYNGGVKDV